MIAHVLALAGFAAVLALSVTAIIITLKGQ
jgi:hypothetical protein